MPRKSRAELMTPYDPPKGAELKVAEGLCTIVEHVKSSLDGDRIFPSPTMASIAADHALTGVRTNGWRELNNIMRVLGKLREYTVAAQAFSEYSARVAEEAKDSLALAELAMQGFINCPECGGRCGRGGQSTKNWKPCDYCGARGIVEARG